MDINLVISIIALVVAIIALSTVFQMWLGKPKIKVFYASAKGYKLWCWIRNLPINNGFLLWMGVERRSRSIRSTITITDENGAIISFLPYDSIISNDIRLGIVEIKSKFDGKVYLKDQNDKYSALIKAGLYKLNLELWDDLKILEERRKFRVNNDYPFVEWIVSEKQ